MKNILIVAYYFPPIATIGSMRPLGFCCYLERYGWRPRVLTTEPKSVYPPMGVDESLCEQLPNTIQVDRVAHKNPERTLLHVRNKFRDLLHKLYPSERSQPLAVANEHASERATADFFGQCLHMKETMLNWLFSFPDPQCFWKYPAVQRLSQIPRNEYPDVVFATGGPWTSLLVGKALAQKFQAPFVADLRDPWTCNPNMEVHSPFLFQRAARLERSIYEAAACVIANTSALRAKLLTDHPDLENKFITITNGFDKENFNVVASCVKNQECVGPASSTNPAVQLSYFGNVYQNRDPLLLLQAIKELIDENRIGSDQLRIRFVGVWDVSEPSCENLARDLEGRGVLKREPPVPHEECVQQMMTAEILLVLLTASPLQIPGKVYEYIAAGRPLLVIGGEGATAQLVEQHQLGVCCPNKVEDIKILLWRLITGQICITPPRKEEQARFEYRTLASELASVLDAVCTGK